MVDYRDQQRLKQWKQKPKKKIFISLNVGAIQSDHQRCQQRTIVGVILVDREVVGEDLLVKKRVHALHGLE